jgi:hypothetical protein
MQLSKELRTKQNELNTKVKARIMYPETKLAPFQLIFPMPKEGERQVDPYGITWPYF